jgi:hypothetical protein
VSMFRLMVHRFGQVCFPQRRFIPPIVEPCHPSDSNKDRLVDSFKLLKGEMEEKARQPETKLGAIAHTRHKASLHDAERRRTKNQTTREAQNWPKLSAEG